MIFKGLVNNYLYRKYEFESFEEAFHFMEYCSVDIINADHHPIWKNNFKTVQVWLTTEEEGFKITEKDEDLLIKFDHNHDLIIGMRP